MHAPFRIPGQYQISPLFPRYKGNEEIRRKSKRTIPMERDLGALAIVILIGLVLSRTLILKRRGIQVMNFGKLDRSDFVIPPFALFYFYLIFAAALHLPSGSTQEFFHSGVISWVGVAFCLTGIVLVGWSIV